MKFSNFILPEILDKTTGLKKLKEEEKGFNVPSVLDTVEETVYFDQEWRNFGTQDSQGQIRKITGFGTESYTSTKNHVHIQGRVYIQGAKYYHLQEQEPVTVSTTTEEPTVVYIRDLNNPGRKTLRSKQKLRNPITDFVLGWGWTCEPYDTDEYYPREQDRILKIPRYKTNKLRVIRDLSVFGLGKLYIPRLLPQADRENYIRNKYRQKIFKFLKWFWVPNRSLHDFYLEDNFDIFDPVNCIRAYSGGNTQQTTKRSLPTITVETIPEQNIWKKFRSGEN
jgi:hypothetical protein